MKIRITKQGLPKAQVGIGEPGIELPAMKQQPNYAWMNFNTPPAPVNPVQQQPQFVMNTQGTPVQKQDPVIPIRQAGRNRWVAAKQNKMTPANYADSPFSKNMRGIASAMTDTVNFMAPVVHAIDSFQKNKEIERAYRQSLFNAGPIDFTQNRGDYEINTGVVDPYNTGAKSKGQYANPYYMPMAADGLSMGPISFSEDPVQRNVFQFASDMVAPEAAASSPAAPPTAAPTGSGSGMPRKTVGINPVVLQTWKDVSTQYEGVENKGIWGDKAHQKTESDHNTADALDIGIKTPQQGNQIAQQMIQEAKQRNVKYVIWNRQIWNPSVSPEWRPYTGKNPHSTHVHVSFYRNESPQATAASNATTSTPGAGEISFTHNNPLNIHHGNFASGYGGTRGSSDTDGHVSIFPDVATGIKAAKDLLFGENYKNLTVAEARNKWVTGQPNKPSSSTRHIVQSMGGNKPLKDLTPAEREKLIKEFAKWEGRQGYNVIKDMKLYTKGGPVHYEEGGVYHLTEDQIAGIMAAGGSVEFI